jgi:hypothetical protein
MTKFKGTKGKCKIGIAGSVVSEGSESLTIGGAIEKEAIEYYGGNLICESVSNSNAELIADAFNTITECDLFPSELLKQRNDMLKALQEMVRMYESVQPAGGWQGVYEQARYAIKKATE